MFYSYDFDLFKSMYDQRFILKCVDYVCKLNGIMIY